MKKGNYRMLVRNLREIDENKRSEQLKCRCDNCGTLVASKMYLDCYGKCQSCTTAF